VDAWKETVGVGTVAEIDALAARAAAGLPLFPKNGNGVH
jgi:hypothetical protein